MRFIFISFLCLHPALYATENEACAHSFFDFIKDEDSKICNAQREVNNAEVSEEVGSGAVVTGMVLEHMNAAGYTYIKIDTKQKQLWLATQELKVKKGDIVEFVENEPMEDFYSKTLKRKFSQIYFVSGLSINGSKAFVSEEENETAERYHKSNTHSQKPEANLAAFLRKYKDKAGQIVAVSGRVTKVNEKIMGKNWIHIVDDSLNAQTQDITITSTAFVQVGEHIKASGRLGLEKDLGSGYFFPVIIEDAKIVRVAKAKK